MVLEIDFNDSKSPWLVTNLVTYIQPDGCYCGPIACVKVMEIFGMVEEGNIKRHQDSMEKLRRTVMNYFNQCVTKYKKQLRAQFRSRYAPDNEDKSNKLIDVVNPSTLATYNSEIALSKKISKQYRQ
jgi:hypothetical protein